MRRGTEVTTTTKTGTRALMVAFVKANGWELDTEATTQMVGGGRRQNPHNFVRPATDGGKWKMHLDYAVNQGYRLRYDNRLREVVLTYTAVHHPAEGAPRFKNRPRDTWTLRNPNGFNRTGPWLWQALEDENTDKPLTLRARAELLVKDPELAVWLAAVAKYGHSVEVQADRVRYEEDRRLRARPLPITVEPYVFRQMTSRLESAAERLHRADGMSHLPTLLGNLQDALDAVTRVVDYPAVWQDSITGWRLGDLSGSDSPSEDALQTPYIPREESDEDAERRYEQTGE
jgi:hypothetical protein